jgi:hypothetical protein
VALSSNTEADDLERGRLAGFREHVAKSDRRALLDVLAHTTQNHVTLERGAA